MLGEASKRTGAKIISKRVSKLMGALKVIFLGVPQFKGVPRFQGVAGTSKDIVGLLLNALKASGHL